MGLKVNIALIKDLQNIYLSAHKYRKLLVGILDEENQQCMYEGMYTNGQHKHNNKFELRQSMLHYITIHRHKDK